MRGCVPLRRATSEPGSSRTECDAGHGSWGSAGRPRCAMSRGQAPAPTHREARSAPAAPRRSQGAAPRGWASSGALTVVDRSFRATTSGKGFSAYRRVTAWSSIRARSESKNHESNSKVSHGIHAAGSPSASTNCSARRRPSRTSSTAFPVMPMQKAWKASWRAVWAGRPGGAGAAGRGFGAGAGWRPCDDSRWCDSTRRAGARARACSRADSGRASPPRIPGMLARSRGPLSGAWLGNTGFEATPSGSVTLVLRAIAGLWVRPRRC
jgi:hypothetical protein